jgi:hypothetical protein
VTLTDVKDKIGVKGVLAVEAVSGLFTKPLTDLPVEVYPMRVVEPPFACRVQEAVNIVVARAGVGFHYTPKNMNDGTAACRYVWNGKADCFVGQVLHQIGVSLSALSMVEGRPAMDAVAVLSSRGQIPGDPTAMELMEVGNALMHAQVVNDHFSSWGKAAAQFRQVLGRPC